MKLGIYYILMYYCGKIDQLNQIRESRNVANLMHFAWCFFSQISYYFPPV